VVVGVDGSFDSIAAVRAGAWTAAARHATLVAVTTWIDVVLTPGAAAMNRDLRATAETILRQSVETALEGRPAVPVEYVVREGSAAGVLLDEGRDAELIVLGSRGHGGFAGLMIGSVSMACTMHASCPVLVMHSSDEYPTRRPGSGAPRIVAGVGDRSAAAVLRTALRAAEELEGDLVALATWSHGAAGTDDAHDELAQVARARLEARLDQTFPDGRPARLSTVVRRGSAAGVLVEESADADLVVVGRQGHSELAHVLRGSVSIPVVAHAKCPVLVVPGEPTATVEPAVTAHSAAATP